MKLSNTIFKAIFFISLITGFFAFCISIFLQYNSFRNDNNHIRTEYLKEKKLKIKNDVINILKDIKAQNDLIEKNLKIKIKQEVNQAYNIAKKIYEEYKNTKDDKEITLLIITTLKNISNKNLFINTTKGKSVFEKSEFLFNTNKNNMSLQDFNGDFIVKKQINLIKEKKSGFIISEFTKPSLGDKKIYKKLFYVKKFEQFDWYIGSSKFIEDEVKKVQNDILNKISKTRFGINNYIFVNTYDGYSLVFDGERIQQPKYWGDTKIFKKEKETAQQKDGAFFFYNFKKIDTIKEFPKVSFVKRYKPWNWIIGTGVYLDEIENELLRKEEVFKKSIYNQIESLIFIFIISTLIIYLLSKTISTFIDSNIQHLINSFKEASKHSNKIDTKKLTYIEFISLARKLNIILQEKNETQTKLERYIKIVNDNVLITTTNNKGIITKASEAFCKLTGYTQDDLINNSFKIMRHQTVPKEFYRKLWRDLKKGISWSGEIKNKDINGQTFWIETIIHPEYKNDELVGYTAIKQDITDKKRIEQLSIIDDLTGLYNRRNFNIKLVEEINRAKRGKRYLSFMMLDIDYFKKYNDTYGHQAGDEALKEVAAVLKKHTQRESDFAFRLGGEEFCIIFSYEKEDGSLEFANLIRQNIENLNIEHKTSEINNVLTVSIGLVIKQFFEKSDIKTIYKEADEALYQAKAQGRNRVCIK